MLLLVAFCSRLRTSAIQRVPTNKMQNNFFVWTDDEVELLLEVTLDYKNTKLADNVDWESCKHKYNDIWENFVGKYPIPTTSNGDFPHVTQAISKSIITSKIKATRLKYKQAKTGSNRQGRVVLLFSGLCDKIWGTSSSRTPTKAVKTEVDSIATSDEEKPAPSQDLCSLEVPIDPPESPSSSIGSEVPTAFVARRRLQTRLERRNKVTVNTFMNEDMRLRRRMLRLLETSVKRDEEMLNQINSTISTTVNTIQQGFSMLQSLVLQQPFAVPLQQSPLCTNPVERPNPFGTMTV